MESRRGPTQKRVRDAQRPRAPAESMAAAAPRDSAQVSAASPPAEPGAQGGAVSGTGGPRTGSPPVTSVLQRGGGDRQRDSYKEVTPKTRSAGSGARQAPDSTESPGVWIFPQLPSLEKLMEALRLSGRCFSLSGASTLTHTQTSRGLRCCGIFQSLVPGVLENPNPRVLSPCQPLWRDARGALVSLQCERAWKVIPERHEMHPWSEVMLN